MALALARGDDPPSPLGRLWEGLEAFPAFPAPGAEVEPAPLAAAAAASLGLAPDATGLADHQRIGDAWEAAAGHHSVIGALLEQLSG